MADTAKQLADAEKNHNRLKKLGTTEATKEFGTYPKYIDALKETRLKLNDAKADHEDSLSGETKGTEKKPKEEKEKAKEPWEMTKAERGTPDANHASRGVFKTKKDAEANLAELMGKLNKSPETKAILDQFGMDSSNTYQVVKSKKLSNRWGIAATHHHEIANAIKSGKSVPAEVLADYPNLVKKPVKEKVEEKPVTPPTSKIEKKEPWEMTRAGIVKHDNELWGDGNEGAQRAKLFLHKHFVKTAIEEGESVPAEVLAEYPDLAKESEKEAEEKPTPTPKDKEPWEMTPDTPQSESPVNAPVDALVQYITGDRINQPDQFRNLYYKLSNPDRVAVAKELNKRGLLHEIDARKKKPMDAITIINSARGQYRNRYYDSKTEYEDFLSRKAKVTEKKPEVEKEKPKAKEPWEISEREYGEQERQISLTSLREDLRKAKSGEEKPNVFLNGAKSKAALIRTIEKDIEDAKYTKPERYSGNHLGFINKAIREGKDVPQANLDRYDIKTEKPAESAKEPEKVAVTPPKEPVAAETGAKGKQVEAAIHKATGLPLNENGTVTVWHHTSASKAGAIRKTGLLVSDAEPDVYVTTHQKPDTGYGDTAVAIGVNPEKLQLDDEFPNGRRDYSIKTGKPGGSIAVSVDKPATPPKEPVAEVKEIKEKPKPTQCKDYHEPIA